MLNLGKGTVIMWEINNLEWLAIRLWCCNILVFKILKTMYSTQNWLCHKVFEMNKYSHATEINWALVGVTCHCPE